MRKQFLVALIAAAFALPLAACKDDGPMEKAGKQMDEAAENLAQSGEDALEKTGKKMDEAVDDMQGYVDEETDD